MQITEGMLNYVSLVGLFMSIFCLNLLQLTPSSPDEQEVTLALSLLKKAFSYLWL
jgi:hypothetical protein